jgi:hypothetical protein
MGFMFRNTCVYGYCYRSLCIQGIASSTRDVYSGIKVNDDGQVTRVSA